LMNAMVGSGDGLSVMIPAPPVLAVDGGVSHRERQVRTEVTA